MGSEHRKPSETSLFIANLHPDVSELMLFEKFRPAGPILSIRVCRDPVTRLSYGYAYVNFQSTTDAQRVVDTMNYDVICGRPVRIMWSLHDPSLYKSGVFIKNLESSIDTKTLEETFSPFGKIQASRMMGDEMGSALVHFERQESAAEAIAKMNGVPLNGHKILVEPFKSRSKREVEFCARAAKDFTNIYIKNFGEEVDDKKLKELFNSCGRMLSVKVMTDETGKSKGFGFVNFEQHEDAQKAVKEMNGRIWNGRIIYVGRAQKKAERHYELKRKFEQIKRDRVNRCQGNNLYVKNLDHGITDERLWKEFSPFGSITSAKVMVEGGRSKGYGFVCFSSPQEASKALTEMNGRIVSKKPLYVSLAQRKAERQAQLTDLYMKRLASDRAVPYGGSSYKLPLFGPMPTLPPAQIHAAYYKNRQIAQVRPIPPWKSQSDIFTLFPNMPGAIQSSPRLPTLNTTTSTQSTEPQITGSTALTGHSVRQYKYSAGARNLHNLLEQLNNRPSIAPQQPSLLVQGQEPLTATLLSSSSPEEQKEVLGERLFPLVQAIQPEMASKITGMLLELDNSELLHMLESPESLHSMVDEAIEVLRTHQTKEASHEKEIKAV
ncbi:hypothetical protein GDO81_010494 [Engystomops pustulosus]|uniref:Polyadenylate-binding protein n=1 Tax=Engystomops pustulosus TaxID=76066 RepID=A0AAV7C1E2_ENGPU|nr:hypothetical protein GDO81_010494 [Engystomops pustulosus]